MVTRGSLFIHCIYFICLSIDLRDQSLPVEIQMGSFWTLVDISLLQSLSTLTKSPREHLCSYRPLSDEKHGSAIPGFWRKFVRSKTGCCDLFVDVASNCRQLSNSVSKWRRRVRHTRIHSSLRRGDRASGNGSVQKRQNVRAETDGTGLARTLGIRHGFCQINWRPHSAWYVVIPVQWRTQREEEAHRSAIHLSQCAHIRLSLLLLCAIHWPWVFKGHFFGREIAHPLAWRFSGVGSET
jgi:hypothetical protein